MTIFHVEKRVTIGVMDWQRFSFDYRLRLEALTPGLIRIEASREAAVNLVLPPDWKTQLDRLNRVRAVHGTTALEGNPLSETEVGRQMDLLAASSTAPATTSRDQRQVQNAGRAQDWIRQRFTPTAAPLRRTDVLRMHELITEGADETDNLPGRLRTHSVVVGTEALGGVHRGAPPQEVSRLVDRFVEFVNSRPFMAQHPVVRALLAHFFLVTIHPFGDGNGRVSRLVEAGILFQGDYNVFGFYGLSNYFYRHGEEYKRLLQESRRTQPFDLNAFVAFGVEGFAAELKGIDNFIKTKLNRVVYRATLVRAFNQRAGKRRRVINQREYGLLDFLLHETEPIDPFAEEPSRKIEYSSLRRAPYVTGVYRNVTARTFYRELTRLAETGFIKFSVDEQEPTIEIDFGAIGRY